MTTRKRRCWAAEVSPCKGPLSREHFLTRGIYQGRFFDSSELDDSVRRTGVSVDDLVVRCLCKRHNTDLSDIDQAGIDFINCLHESNRLHDECEYHRGLLEPVNFVVSGRSLQRWAFKTAASAWARLQKALGSQPHGRLARLAFGLDEPVARSGLALLGRKGNEVVYEETMSVHFDRDPEQYEPTGMILRVWGITFYVTWQPMPEGMTLATDTEEWLQSEIVFQPKAIVMRSNGLVTSVDFDWRDPFEDDPKVVHLRSVYS